MSLYYCPYCPSQYKFHKTKTDGVLICGLCGDPLVKKSFFNYRRIVGVLLALAFLSPLLVMIIFLLTLLKNDKMQDNSQSVVFVVKSI